MPVSTVERRGWRLVLLLALPMLLFAACMALAVPAETHSGGKLLAQTAGDPEGNPEMNRTRIGRLEPIGPSTPTPTATPTCGPSWRTVSSPNAGSLENHLQSVDALSGSDVWAVGYTGPWGSRQTLAEHWDGSNWRVIPSPNVGSDDHLHGVAAISRNDVWAVGSTGDQTLTMHWDGTQWRVVPSANPSATGNYLTGVSAVSSNDIWAAGYYQDSVTFLTLVEHWDGRQWSVVPSPNVANANNEFLGITAFSANDAWAVGNYTKGSVLQTLAAHWDGTGWSILPSPNAGPWSSFFSVAAISPQDVWAVGGYSEMSPLKTEIQHWDGAKWSIVPSKDAGPGSTLSSVAALSTNDVWAVGQSLGTGQSIIEHWDGAAWSIVPGPSLTGNSFLNGIATLSGDEMWAVGDYAEGGSASRTLTELYSDSCPPTGTPTSAPTHTATATAIATSTATPCPMTFTDVQPTDYFYEAVRYLYCRGVVSGYADNTFHPYNLTTRGQLCKIVVLAEGWVIYTPPAPTFIDVPSDHPFYQHIETAYRQGIISGYNCGSGCLEFRPGSNVTREQLCKIIVLAEGWAIYAPPTPTFVDVPINDPFYQHIETAYHQGIISGYSCGAGCLEFRPGNNATRGQICKIVYGAVTAPGEK